MSLLDSFHLFLTLRHLKPFIFSFSLSYYSNGFPWKLVFIISLFKYLRFSLNISLKLFSEKLKHLFIAFFFFVTLVSCTKRWTLYLLYLRIQFKKKLNTFPLFPLLCLVNYGLTIRIKHFISLYFVWRMKVIYFYCNLTCV